MHRRTDAPVLTIGELTERYLAHCRVYYRRADGSPTREHLNIAAALRWLNDRASDEPAAEITKHDVRAIQADMIRYGRCRRYINDTVRRVRAMFQWAIQEDLIEDTPDDPCATRVLGAFTAVRVLKANRSSAVEHAPIAGVALATVRATLPYMPRLARDIIEVLLLTGARVSEIARLRIGDVRQDLDGTWWAYPRQHKTRWRGHERPIPLDARCMEIIRQHTPAVTMFGELDQDAFLFPSKRRRPYTPDGLRTVLERAIVRANAAGRKIPHWHLHQLRHTVATLARRAAGLEDAQALMGHRTRKMTEHYAGCENPRGARRAQKRVAKLVKGVR